MNIEQMSERLQKILMDAINLAKSNQHPSVDTVDMLETIFKDDVLDGLFERIGLDKARALQMVQKESNRVAKSSTSNINRLRMHKTGQVNMMRLICRWPVYS